MSLKQFLDTVDCRITEGSEYCWTCYGPNAYRLEVWSGDHGGQGHSIECVFDTVTQEVFEMTAHDYSNQRSYRWIDPAYTQAHRDEAKTRSVDIDQAYDDVRFIDLETVDDYLQKARAIFLGQDYDTRVVLPVDLPDELLFELMKDAHRRDITFNQLMERILREACETALLREIDTETKT